MTEPNDMPLSLFFTLSPDLLCIAGKDGYFKKVNPSFTCLLGYTEEELLKAPFMTFVHPDNRAATQQFFLELPCTMPVGGFENRYLTKSGSNCCVVWTSVQVYKDLIYAIGKDYTSEKLLKEKLNESHDELNMVLESTTDAFITIDRNWIIRYINSQAEKIYNLTRVEVKGKNLLTLMPEIRKRKFYAMAEQAFRDNKKVEFENYLEPLKIWLEVAIYPMPRGLAIFFRDITDKKMALEKIRESNERYRLVSLGTSEAVWDRVIGNDQIYWHVDNYKKQFGYDFADGSAPFSQWSENIHPDDSPGVWKTLQEALNDPGEHCWSGQYRFRKATGEYVYVKDSAYILRDVQGKASRIVGAMVDITKQKLAELAVMESELNYRTLFDNAPLPQCIYEMDTFQILKVNEAMIMQYGYSKEAFVKLKATDISRAAEWEDLDGYFEALRSQKKYYGTATHIKKNGETFPVTFSTVIIEYDHRECILATINDVSEKISLEKKLSRERLLRQKKITQATIEGQEKERAQIGRELHDNINQMIATIKLYLETARVNEAYRLPLIEKCEKISANVIEEIRNLSKALLPPTIEENSLVDAVQSLIAPYQLTKKFIIGFSYSGESAHLPIDLQTCLYRIIQEQLNNIVKHAEATKVSIELETGSQVSLKIRDNGKGFDVTALRKGIGITNIKSRAEVYGGMVHIISAPGKGCSLELKIRK